MRSVRVLYDVPNWAFYQVALALGKYAPAGFEVTAALWRDTAKDALDEALGPVPPDFVIVNQFRHAPRVRAYIQSRGWDTKIVSIWNVGWPRRTEFLSSVLVASDGIIFINEEYWRHVGRLAAATCIPHGVDLDVFKPQAPVAERPRRVLWLGSKVNRTLKGYDDIIEPLGERLGTLGFECDFRLIESNDGGPLDTREMADWYNSGRILLCASDCEGTPNVALEAAACGCVLVSTTVGNMPELIRHGHNGMLVDRTVDGFVEAICEADAHCGVLSTAILDDIREWGWDILAPRVFEYLHDLVQRQGRREAAAPAATAYPIRALPVLVGDADGPDIGADVTVYVSTVGAQTFDACLRLLDQQDCRFGLRIIRNVSPLSAAFQRILDDCTTPFYIQVDEDMLLYPHAVRTLHETMQGLTEDTAIHAGLLFDTHVCMNIYGVKIFRHDVVKRYPFRDVESCDIDQNERLQADGFALSLGGETGGNEPDGCALGLHGTVYTPSEAFYRYLKLSSMSRRRGGQTGWESLPVAMARRLVEDGSESNAHALLGAMAGLVVPLAEDVGEKDCRNQGRSVGYRALSRFYSGAARDT